VKASVSPREHVTILTRDSQQLHAKDIAPTGGNPFRIFSVDGGHTVDGVLHDLHLVVETLAYEGIALDDMYNPICPGVTEAYFIFDREQNRQQFKPFAYVANKLLLTQRGSTKSYYDLFAEWL
jgi:hypothetical protein